MATDHVNGNGTEEPMDTTASVTHSEHFQALLEAGLPQNVAEKLDELYVAGKHKLHLIISSCVFDLKPAHQLRYGLIEDGLICVYHVCGYILYHRVTQSLVGVVF